MGKAKSGDRIDMVYDEFLKELKDEVSESRLGLSKGYELAYMTDNPRSKKIVKGIPSSEERLKILDIGTTPFTFFIKRLYPHYDIATIDLTDLMKQRCEARDIMFKKCNLEKDHIPFEDNYFDVVIFTEVLEHLLVPPTVVLREILRVLSVGGKLIFSVPNFATLLNRMKLLFGITPMAPADNQMKQGWVHGHGHAREYTMKELLSILTGCNFTILRREFVGATPNVRAIRNVYQLMLQVYRLICLIIPSLRGIIFVECYKLTQKTENRIYLRENGGEI